MPALRYRLALDLGSTSLGWAMIRLNLENKPCAIIKAGARIYANGRESAPEGQQGESLAKVRREKRQARRRRDRILKRKSNVMGLLIKHGLFPDAVADQRLLEILNPYQIRAEGLSRELPLHHFGRALFHLSVRRGFKSNRKTDKEDPAQSLMKVAMSNLDNHIKDYKTLGAYLNHRVNLYPNPEPGQAVVRAKSHILRRPNKRNPEKFVEKNDWEFFVRRSMVEAEFDELWKAQLAFHGDRLPEAAREEIQREIFFQRKLRPVDPGRCTLMPNLHRAYKAYPVAQALIAMQTVNNLRLLDAHLQPQQLTARQRADLTAELLNGRDLPWHSIKGTLQLPATTLFNLENGGDKRTGIDGDQTTKILKAERYFGEAWLTKFSETLRHRIVWKILNTQDEVSLTNWLIVKTGVSLEKARALTKVQLPSGVTAYSRRVSSRLVSHLKNYQGSDSLVLHVAIEQIGLGSHSERSHHQLTGETLEFLPDNYGDYMIRHVGLNGRIANPTVHIGLNQVRVVVNALIQRYGKPTQVHVELARDLKLNAKQREKANELNKRNREDRDRRRKIFLEEFKRKPTDAEMEKLLLWEELNPSDSAARCCPYTGKQIGIRALILSSEVEVDHILPKTLTLDDGVNNKTLAFVSANRAKSNKSPFDAFGDSPTINGVLYNYEAVLLRAKQMRREKYMRFAPNALEWWLGSKESMPDRYLNETRHLSVVAREYLSLVCSDITCTTGQLTAMVRNSLHLNLSLNSENRKNRFDHRHHAVDACVIGIIDRRFIQAIATASAKTNHYRVGMMVDSMPLPWPRFCNDVDAVVKAIKVSHKPDHSFEGRLFGEMRAYAFAKDGSVVQAKKAHSEKRAYTVTSVVPVHHRKAAQETRAPFGEAGRPYKGYPSEGNYCLEIVKAEEGGKWDFEVIPTYVAYQQALERGGKAHQISMMARKIYEQKLSAKPGQLIMKLVKGDCIAFAENGTTRLLRLTKMSQDGGGTFTEIHESNESERADLRRSANKKMKRGERMGFLDDLALKDTVFVKQLGIAALFEGKARRVTISPIGELRDPGFKP